MKFVYTVAIIILALGGVSAFVHLIANVFVAHRFDQSTTIFFTGFLVSIGAAYVLYDRLLKKHA